MANERRILVAEDDLATRRAWSDLITSWGFQVATAADGAVALQLAESFAPHILLLDLRLPRMDGFGVLTALRERNLDIPTIVISGQGEIPDAVRAIKLGAYDYQPKPIDPDHLHVTLRHLCDHLDVSREKERLLRRLMKAGELGQLVGSSAPMRRVMALIEQVAPSTAAAIIRGESGTGKELVARTIHELSSRSSGPYVAVNCAAMPDTLMESELFGHERGAFTGAERKREGCFELANGGTLLLDEISEMKPELQAKLLRVLEEQKLRRLGGTTEVKLEVRVLAATNCDLETAIREGRFREDLYYRLNVFTVELPPLREHPEDMPLLIEHFLGEFRHETGKEIGGVDDECLKVMQSYGWPGNVRQLRNVMQRACIVSRGPLITEHDLPPEIRRRNGPGSTFELRLGCSLEEAERELIERTLGFVEGNKARAAEVLGVSIKTLYNRLERYQSKAR